MNLQNSQNFPEFPEFPEFPRIPIPPPPGGGCPAPSPPSAESQKPRSQRAFDKHEPAGDPDKRAELRRPRLEGLIRTAGRENLIRAQELLMMFGDPIRAVINNIIIP